VSAQPETKTMESESRMDISQEADAAVKKHVRPRVRSKNALSKIPTSSTTSTMEPPVSKTADHDNDPAVEETRQRIETWVGIQPSKAETEEAKPKPEQHSEQSNPSGILKPPKYSGQSENMVEGDEDQVREDKPQPMIRDVVMERPKRQAQRQAAAATGTSQSSALKSSLSSRADPTAIEGYTPTTMPAISTKNNAKAKTTTFAADTKPSDEDEDDPLVFNSLADLMEAAGTKPPDDWNDPEKPPAVVEAELSFSCMDPDEYKERILEEEEEEEEDFEPHVDENSGDDDDDDDDNVQDDNMQKEQEDGGFLTDFFSNEDDEEPVQRREERAFLTLWKAIAHWVTPEAVAYLTLLHERQQEAAESGQAFAWDNEFVPQVDRSDVGASRCAGLMALLQMHIPRCLQELGRSMEERRTAERRLADLLRCWDYGRPAAVKLGTKLSRALTCVLLETVLVGPGLEDDTVKLPASCQAVDMKLEEYRYLTRSAILSFGASSSVAE
jgi:hypothetical protein